MTKLPALTPDDPLRIAEVTQPPQPATAATPVTAKESERTPAPRTSPRDTSPGASAGS